MAVSKQEVVIEFNAETGKVDKAIAGIEKDMQGLSKAANEAADATAGIGSGAEQSGSGLKKMGQLGGAGFKIIGGAIAATGIGLLVQIVAKLIEKFTENKKVAEALKVASAALGAVLNGIVEIGEKLLGVLIDAFENPQATLESFKDALKENITNRLEGLLELLPALGEAIGLIFEGKFGQAAKKAGDAVGKVALGVENVTDKMAAAAEAVGDFVAETVDATVAATQLERNLQKLSDRERDLAVLTAQSSAEVEELKRQRDDERLSIEERIAAAEAAAAIDQRIADENVRIQEEKARLLAQEIELQGETEERLQALADAQIAAADARAASAGVQTELMTSLYALNQELIDQGIAQLEQLQETRDALNEARTTVKEIEQERTNAERGLMMSQRRQTEIVETESQRRRRIRQEEFEVFTEFVLKDQETMLNASKGTLDLLTQLNESFTGETEEPQRKGFERSKKIQAAQALIATFEATIQAYKSVVGTPFVGPVLAPIAAAATAAVGLKNVQAIKQQQFAGGTQPDTGAGGGGLPDLGAGGGAGAPTLDLGFLGAGAGQQGPIQAYVLAENVSTAQQANQKIQDQATL